MKTKTWRLSCRDGVIVLEMTESTAEKAALPEEDWEELAAADDGIGAEAEVQNAAPETVIGQRLDIFVAEREAITRSASQKWIEQGLVTVDGKIAEKNRKLKGCETVAYTVPEPVTMDAKPQNIPIEVMYEDGAMLVVNKPKGMVVHPAPGNPDGTLVNALLYYCGDRLSSINGVIRPGIVHRIDRDTSGLLMVAKRDDSHLHLAKQIAEHSFERTYHTVVVGNIKDDEGVVDAPIGRHPTDRKKMAVVPSGRRAVTNYRVLERFGDFTYLEVKLQTGRTHQIRVHMASLGHAVLCDPLYSRSGGKNKFENSVADTVRGQCLHAKTVGFIHPDTGAWMRFDSDLPDYFQAVLTKLRDRS